MDISETIQGTDYFIIGSNLIVESVIDVGSTEMCCLAMIRESFHKAILATYG